MSRSITITFDGKNELLLQAIEAYEKLDLFEDDEGNAVKLSADEIALNMLMEGCIRWVQDFPGLPEDLEENIVEAFELDEEFEGDCDDEDCDECDDGECSDDSDRSKLN